VDAGSATGPVIGRPLHPLTSRLGPLWRRGQPGSRSKIFQIGLNREAGRGLAIGHLLRETGIPLPYDIDYYGQRPGQPVPRDVRRAAQHLARHQLANQVQIAAMSSDTDVAIEQMEDDTVATGSAMGNVVRVAQLQRRLEEIAPEASGRLNQLAEDHAFGMSDDVARLRRRLNRKVW
jgi:hypothetical protein